MKSWRAWVRAAGMSCSARMRSHSSHDRDAKASSRIGVSDVTVIASGQPRGEPRVIGQLGPTERLAQLHPEALVAARQEQPLAVARPVQAIRRRLANDRLTAREVDHQPGLEREDRVEQRGLHLLPAAGALAHVQRGEDPLAGEGRAVVVGRRAMRRYCGGPPKPWSVMSPPMAWSRGSKPGRSRYGPVAPKAVTEE